MTKNRAKLVLSFFIILINGDSFALNKNTSYPKLTMHGEFYENSCTSKEKRELFSNIQKSPVQNTRILQEAVDLILCAADTPKNRQMVLRLIDRVITTTYEGTGEEKVVGKSTVHLGIANDVMAKGRAWSTTLQFNGDEVTLQYFSNEACVEGVKLRSSGKSWRVYEIGGSCD